MKINLYSLHARRIERFVFYSPARYRRRRVVRRVPVCRRRYNMSRCLFTQTKHIILCFKMPRRKDKHTFFRYPTLQKYNRGHGIYYYYYTQVGCCSISRVYSVGAYVRARGEAACRSDVINFFMACKSFRV